MNPIVLERGSALLALIFASRVWARWRVGRRQRAALVTPLVDAATLEAVFAPRPRDGDDTNLLAEMRDTFAHLNRQAYAEEFWNLHAQLAALAPSLSDPARATLRRAIVRLVVANDRWLQLVGAKTAAALRVTEAAVPLRGVLEMGDANRFAEGHDGYGAGRAVEARFRAELEAALAALS